MKKLQFKLGKEMINKMNKDTYAKSQVRCYLELIIVLPALLVLFLFVLIFALSKTIFSGLHKTCLRAVNFLVQRAVDNKDILNGHKKSIVVSSSSDYEDCEYLFGDNYK